MSNEELKNVAAACPNFYGKLFQSTFLISAFTVGGGFVIIPLLRAKYVDEYGWLSDKETLNLVSIAQSMPGVVAVNAITFDIFDEVRKLAKRDGTGI